MSASVQYVSSQQWKELCQVSPSQFNVTCQLQKQESIQLHITNTCNNIIAWKLKTNRLGRYTVSPKQGIINPKNEQDCTVVLSKLTEIPDTKKPDKFLIQATKINPNTQINDLPQLWKDRELKHDKKHGAYAYQSITIKCYLTIIQPNDDNNGQNNANPAKLNIIEDYVSSESIDQPTAIINKPKPTANIKQNKNKISIDNIQQHTVNKIELKAKAKPKPISIAQPHVQPQPQQQPKVKPKLKPAVASIVIDKDVKPITTKTDKDVDAVNQPITTNEPTYDADLLEKWRRKADEYDELFAFTRKTLAQRDELNKKWQSEQQKSRSLQKLNKDLQQEKKRILKEYNKNQNNDDDNDNKQQEEDDDDDGDEKYKHDIMDEMNKIDKTIHENNKRGIQISIIHIVITLFAMYIAYSIGKYFGANSVIIPECNNNIIQEPLDMMDNNNSINDNTEIPKEGL